MSAQQELIDRLRQHAASAPAISRQSIDMEAAADRLASLEAERREISMALDYLHLAQPEFCSARCPSVGREGVPIPHLPECVSMRSLLDGLPFATPGATISTGLIAKLKKLANYLTEQGEYEACDLIDTVVDRLSASHSIEPGAVSDDVVERLVPHLAARFLCWKLPSDFCPDAGISFAPDYNVGTPYQARHEPTGTNLLNAEQAFALIRHLLDHPAVRTALPQSNGVQDGWLPIESAPKDGTWVLLVIGIKSPRVVTGKWSLAWEADEDGPEEFGWINDDDEAWHAPATHWRPLPSPPSEKATGQ